MKHVKRVGPVRAAAAATLRPGRPAAAAARRPRRSTASCKLRRLAPPPARMAGEATLERADGGTTVSLTSPGWSRRPTYVAHLHTGGCDQADPGGPHFKFDAKAARKSRRTRSTSSSRSTGRRRGKRDGVAAIAKCRSAKPARSSSTKRGTEHSDRRRAGRGRSRTVVHEGDHHGEAPGPARRRSPAPNSKVATRTTRRTRKQRAAARRGADDRRPRRRAGRRRRRSSSTAPAKTIRFGVDLRRRRRGPRPRLRLSQQVPAGGTVSFDFPAEIEGIFEVELEDRKDADRGAAGQPVSLLPFAHALAARQDLPIPAWLFAWGASIVLIVSFFALSVAWRKPRFEEARWRPLGAGLSRALLGLPVQVALRTGRGLPARGRGLLRPARHRSAGPQLRPHLPLRHLLARLPLLLGVCSATSSGPSTRGGRSAAPPARASARSPASAPPISPTPSWLGRWPAAIGLLAVVWLEVVYGVQRRGRGRPRPGRRRRRRPRLQRLHAGDDGPVRGREVVRAGRGLLGLLRDVRPARLLRRRRTAGSVAAARSRRDALGDVPGSAAVVIASIATTSFDGASEGAFKGGDRKHLRLVRRPRART